MARSSSQIAVASAWRRSQIAEPAPGRWAATAAMRSSAQRTLMDLNITRNTERGTLARRSPRLFRVPRSDFRVFVVPFLPMSYDTLLFETRDAVAFITINRPDKLNALNDQVVDELSHAAERV